MRDSCSLSRISWIYLWWWRHIVVTRTFKWNKATRHIFQKSCWLDLWPCWLWIKFLTKNSFIEWILKFNLKKSKLGFQEIRTHNRICFASKSIWPVITCYYKSLSFLERNYLKICPMKRMSYIINSKNVIIFQG